MHQVGSPLTGTQESQPGLDLEHNQISQRVVTGQEAKVSRTDHSFPRGPHNHLQAELSSGRLSGQRAAFCPAQECQ